MIARTDPSKSPPSLLGHLVHLSAVYFPLWTGVVLIFYSLTMFEFMPGNVRDRVISWFGAGFSSPSKE